MNKLVKKAGKQFSHVIGASQLLNELHFRYQQCRNYIGNRQFQKKYKRFVFPSDRALFNTFQLNYQQYYQDGLLAANELIEWSKASIQKNPVILDWGTGSGRIIRHIPSLLPDAVCYGADLDASIIEWCKKILIRSILTKSLTSTCPIHPITLLAYGAYLCLRIYLLKKQQSGLQSYTES
ncbi:hypothetical protein [Sediminibacterium salmoneum]|uniref:hypothetical protein n=1 Tax=Sediminibacterium salmoneum TaxID=426421 RepID=UPI00047A6239|nr:hypothetical protein [Sediminibacterium salmoneum]